jgi:hypothetical protein
MMERIASNLGNTLFVAALHYAGTSRDALATEYNAWVDRVRRDYERRYQIQAEMRSNLAKSSEHIDHLDRVIDRLQRLPLSQEDRQRWVVPIVEGVNEWRTETVRLRANL